MNKIEDLKILLRENRIKHGVDYAIIHKYNITRILCHKIWKEEIEECANELELKINEWYTYEN